MFPSWPSDALIVGSPNADENDFTVSDMTPDIVVSNTTCGVWSIFTASMYREQTYEWRKKISWFKIQMQMGRDRWACANELVWTRSKNVTIVTSFEEFLRIIFVSLNRFEMHRKSENRILLDVGEGNVDGMSGQFIIRLIDEYLKLTDSFKKCSRINRLRERNRWTYTHWCVAYSSRQLQSATNTTQRMIHTIVNFDFELRISTYWTFWVHWKGVVSRRLFDLVKNRRWNESSRTVRADL